MAINEKEKSLGSGKRFGVRYGRSLKQTFAQIEKEHRKLHVCPYCAYTQVKRLSAGIWQCRKCNAKFTGKAYSVEKQIFAKEGEDIKAEIEITARKEEKEDMVEEDYGRV